MTTTLPKNPSLENLKKQAKAVQNAWQHGNPETLARIRAVHPRYGGLSDEQLATVRPRLSDCQLVIAREAGFDSWPRLKVAVEATNCAAQDEFVSIACLCYDDPHYDHRSFQMRASQMLIDKPWLAGANIWCAAVAGNADAVEKFLNAQPQLANQPGVHGWVPLICACYSRVKPLNATQSTFEVAKILLDRGANPNAFTMKGNADDRLGQKPRRFSALTGLFGGGSTGLANQPPHPHWRDLAELLLNHEGSPNDEMALSINQEACLEILLRRGLAPELMGHALCRAVWSGHTEHVRLLLSEHARMDEKFQDKTAWEHAISLGRVEIASLLEEAGAPVSALSDVEQFVSLCLAGEDRGVRKLLENDPDLLKRAPKAMVLKAANTGLTKAVRLVLNLGFDPDCLDEVTALHHAAGRNNEEMVRLLLKSGARLTIREPFYDGTPVGWAHFFDQRQMRDLLLNEGAICLFDALEFDRLDRIPDILARDKEALNRPFAECLSRAPRPEDCQTPLGRMVSQGKADAAGLLRRHGALTNIC